MAKAQSGTNKINGKNSQKKTKKVREAQIWSARQEQTNKSTKKKYGCESAPVLVDAVLFRSCCWCMDIHSVIKYGKWKMHWKTLSIQSIYMNVIWRRCSNAHSLRNISAYSVWRERKDFSNNFILKWNKNSMNIEKKNECWKQEGKKAGDEMTNQRKNINSRCSSRHKIQQIM